MKQAINPRKVVVFTGAGVSAESGLKTFRDNDGLWYEHRVEDVATPEAFARDPGLVLEFYNQRRLQTKEAQPNAAHLAIARLEEKYEVVVITQNVDDLHERAGSTNVIHLHGLLSEARSSSDPSLIYERGMAPLNLGDLCEKGSQLRPNIVWFGESVVNIDLAAEQFPDAGKVLVIGTSLNVYPAAGLVKFARYHAEKIIVSLDLDQPPYGFKWMRGKAATVVPTLVDGWLAGE